MKKFTALFIGMVLCLSLTAGCGNNQTTITEKSESETVTKSDEDMKVKENSVSNIRVTALKGPTAMGMVKLMEDSGKGTVNGNQYDFTISPSVDEVTPKLVQGEIDIAAVPANLASVLYNNTDGGVQVLAVNTLGVLYIVSTLESIQTVEDLKGMTVYASGKGAIPEYALNYILSSNGIDTEKDVNIEWKSEHSECVSALVSSDKEAAALLPQPFVTTAQMKNDKIRMILDLTKEWDRLQEKEETSSALLTGVIVARTDFIKENPEAVNTFMDSYKESVEYVNKSTADAAQLIEKYDIVTAAVAEKALPYCNIVFIEGTEMKEMFSGYLNVLMAQNPKSVGGEIPADDFYYIR